MPSAYSYVRSICPPPPSSSSSSSSPEPLLPELSKASVPGGPGLRGETLLGPWGGGPASRGRLPSMVAREPALPPPCRQAERLATEVSKDTLLMLVTRVLTLGTPLRKPGRTSCGRAWGGGVVRMGGEGERREGEGEVRGREGAAGDVVGTETAP